MEVCLYKSIGWPPYLTLLQNLEVEALHDK